MLEKKPTAPAGVVGFNDIRRPPISDWQEFLEQGNQFLATAVGAHAKARKAFTPEILYNLVAMAIEKLLMALLMKSGNLPYNHTMHDLVAAMEEFLPGSLAGLEDDLRKLDGFQDICDPGSYSIIVPDTAEVAGMIGLAEKVRTLTVLQIDN